jgi:hypothetical protein
MLRGNSSFERIYLQHIRFPVPCIHIPLLREASQPPTRVQLPDWLPPLPHGFGHVPFLQAVFSIQQTGAGAAAGAGAETATGTGAGAGAAAATAGLEHWGVPLALIPETN